MFNFRYGLDYLGHWFSSNSRHGVHSPFVYRLVDEVIYNFRAQTSNQVKAFKSQKVNRLAERLLDFFKKDFRDYTDVKDSTDLNDTSDWVIIRSNLNTRVVIDRLVQKAGSDTILMLEGIYLNKGMKTNWNEIKIHPKVSVSIDLFDVGLVFFRTGQAKENFKIRF